MKVYINQGEQRLEKGGLPASLDKKKHRYINIAEGKLNSQGLSILGWPQCHAKIDDNTNKECEPRQNTALERSVINDWAALRYFIVHLSSPSSSAVVQNI